MGVPEINMAGEDERFINDMLYHMNCGRAVNCIVNIARLGKYRGKRRLVKVDFNDTRAAREVLDSSYCLAGSWYSNIYIKTDRTFAEREQVENSKSSHILAQSASGANGNASTGTVPDQVQRGGKQSRWEANQIEKGDSRSGPDQDHAQGGNDKIVANASNTGVELVQNMGKLVREMRPKADQGTINPVADTTQDQAKNEGSSKGAEGGQSQGLVQGPQDSSDGGDIWHLASEGDEMQVGGGYKQGDRGDSHQDSKTGGLSTVKGDQGNPKQTSKISTPTREEGGKGFLDRVRSSPAEFKNWLYGAGGGGEDSAVESMTSKNEDEIGEMGGGGDIAVEENAPGNKTETEEGNQSQDIGAMGGLETAQER